MAETLTVEYLETLHDFIFESMHNNGVMIGAGLAFLAGVVVEMHRAHEIDDKYVGNFVRLLASLVANPHFNMRSYIKNLVSQNNELVIDIVLRKIIEEAKS
jgi:hypothetical protein